MTPVCSGIDTDRADHKPHLILVHLNGREEPCYMSCGERCSLLPLLVASARWLHPCGGAARF